MITKQLNIDLGQPPGLNYVISNSGASDRDVVSLSAPCCLVIIR